MFSKKNKFSQPKNKDSASFVHAAVCLRRQSCLLFHSPAPSLSFFKHRIYIFTSGGGTNALYGFYSKYLIPFILVCFHSGNNNNNHTLLQVDTHTHTLGKQACLVKMQTFLSARAELITHDLSKYQQNASKKEKNTWLSSPGAVRDTHLPRINIVPLQFTHSYLHALRLLIT